MTRKILLIGSFAALAVACRDEPATVPPQPVPVGEELEGEDMEDRAEEQGEELEERGEEID